MSKHLVITFMGKDQPGVVESLSTTISNLGANWLESRMCHLGGQFAGVLRVAVEDTREADLIKSLLITALKEDDESMQHTDKF